MLINIKKYRYYFIGIVFILIILVIFGLVRKNNSDLNNIQEEKKPVPIESWNTYKSNYGFSFMHPDFFKLEDLGETIKVGGLIIKIEKLACSDKGTNNLGGTKLYGFPAKIIESEKKALICNNKNTACLDISKDENFKETKKTKITEGFFHSFISSLNINQEFNKINCN